MSLKYRLRQHTLSPFRLSAMKQAGHSLTGRDTFHGILLGVEGDEQTAQAINTVIFGHGEIAYTDLRGLVRDNYYEPREPLVIEILRSKNFWVEAKDGLPGHLTDGARAHLVGCLYMQDINIPESKPPFPSVG